MNLIFPPDTTGKVNKSRSPRGYVNIYACWISRPCFSVLALLVGICSFFRCFCWLLQNRQKRQKKAIGRLMAIGINCRGCLRPINQYPALKEHWREEKLQWTVQIQVNLQFYIKTVWELFIVIILWYKVQYLQSQFLCGSFKPRVL